MIYNAEDNHHKLTLAIELKTVLAQSGFERDRSFERGPENLAEQVYSKPVQRGIKVVVYTSCSGHKGYLTARSKGNDAIRVATIYENKSGNRVGLAKQSRVYRTGEIHEIKKRVCKRIVSAYRVGSNPERCKHCESVKFVSKKGNLVCAEFCWTKK